MTFSISFFWASDKEALAVSAAIIAGDTNVVANAPAVNKFVNFTQFPLLIINQ